MSSESEKIIVQMKALIDESKRLHERHNEIVLQFQELHEKLQRLQQREKRKGSPRGLGRT